MKHSLLLSILFLLAVVEVSAYKQVSIDITVNGKKRNMVVFTPNTFPAKSPLFIVTHGMNQSPEYQYDSDKMYEMIDTAKFVIAYLRSDGNTWDIGGTNDQTFVIKAIDKMVEMYDIDRERVYWSGFSMGSMLIHHCIANMQDKIAAFAPTSGIQFSESPWNNCKKPVNLLEVIAYGDGTFGYEEYHIHDYIESYATHDKHTTYSKTSGYKPISTSWYDGDLEKWTGGANGGEVWLYSYHNGGHWPMDLNRHLIWNFCKRFYLNMPMARFIAPTGETTHLYMAPKGEAVFPDITLKATAKAPNGSVAQFDFYDGNTLIESQTSAPHITTLAAPSAGKHNLRVEVTDNKGKKAQTSCLVNNITSSTNYDLFKTIKNEGMVPQNWYVSNGTTTTKRVGGGLVYTSGPRTLRFTNTTKSFEYGLLVQNNTSKEKAAWAKFGDKNGRSQLTLHEGRYAIKYKVCNWNQPEFSPVTLSIQNLDGEEIASETYTPTVNINGNTANRFLGVNQRTFMFDVPETGDYVIVFYTAAERNSDFVLGAVSIQAANFAPVGIAHVKENKKAAAPYAYDFNGRKFSTENLKPGLYIINGQKVMVK